MKTKRHNKKRNTAFLYETLINEMTKAVVSGEKDKASKITNLIKNYFSDGGILKEKFSKLCLLFNLFDLFKKLSTKKLVN